MALLPGRAKNNDPATAPLTASEIKERYVKGYKSILEESYNYWLNYAFLRNHQWLFFNQETKRLDVIPRDPDRVQATVNQLLPTSRTVIAKATSRELDFDVNPTAADDATVRAAKISEAVLSETHTEHDWETLREDSIWAMWRGGTSAISVDWDPAAGTPLENDPDTGRPVGTGDTVETVLSTVEFCIEPGTKIAERGRWWIKAQVVPPETARADWKLDKTPAADATAGMSPFQQKLLSEHTTMGTGTITPLTLVLTYYERPNPLRPVGVVATVIGDEIVDGGPHGWPFPWTDRLNIAVLRETHVDARWTGDTVLTAARSVQVALNAAWSSVLEHLKLAGNARMMMPQSAADLITTLTDLPGEVLPYPDGTERPTWETPPQMPEWWLDSPQRLKEELDDILGVHDVTKGLAPRNIESGFGLSILAEEDATPIGRMVKESATAWSKIATMVLQLLAKNVKDTRNARVAVSGQAPETAAWSGKDLMGQTRATVPVDAILPRSRAAMQAFAEKAMQMGLIQNVAQFARLAEYPQQDDFIEAVAPDIGKARRENHSLAIGKIPIPDDFDDHVVHIKEHNDFRKSARYTLLDQQAKDVCALHIKGHETLAAEAMGRQVAKGQVSPALAAAPDASGAPTLPIANAGPNPTADTGAETADSATPPATPAAPAPLAAPNEGGLGAVSPNTWFRQGEAPPVT